MWLWANHCTALSLSFLCYKPRIRIPTLPLKGIPRLKGGDKYEKPLRKFCPQKHAILKKYWWCFYIACVFMECPEFPATDRVVVFSWTEQDLHSSNGKLSEFQETVCFVNGPYNTQNVHHSGDGFLLPALVFSVKEWYQDISGPPSHSFSGLCYTPPLRYPQTVVLKL